jgi:hypothetical protein
LVVEALSFVLRLWRERVARRASAPPNLNIS